MSVNIGEVPTFEELPDNPREQAKKILEEAAEVFAAVEIERKLDSTLMCRKAVVEECADVIMATANLLAWYGINDTADVIKFKARLNERRGYEYEKEEER